VLASLRRTLRDQVLNRGLSRPATRLYRAVAGSDPRIVLGNARYRREGAPDGLPLPPADLRFLVAGTTSISWFLEAGALAFESIREILARNETGIEKLPAVLDFGCGCGRVLRQWNSIEGPRISGCDYNARLVEWCRENLPFADARVNQLAPPLPYRDAEFDLVYALSVFTHLTDDLQLPWMVELARIVKPNGSIVFTTHGASYSQRLNTVERSRFDRGELVVKNNVSEPGSNACSAYHPLEYVREHLAAGLDLVDFTPTGARGNPHQDLYLVRKPADAT
jgi:SAM-dependent methyltransferase